MRSFIKSLAIGAALAAVVVSPIFGQSHDVNPARAAAMHECNKLASPYVIYTWGNWQCLSPVHGETRTNRVMN
jgi:hypothetical protein